MSFAGLPSSENGKLHNIHFIACSNKAAALDMSGPIVDDLLQLENGVVVYDAVTQQQVFALCPVICCLCDNV